MVHVAKEFIRYKNKVSFKRYIDLLEEFIKSQALARKSTPPKKIKKNQSKRGKFLGERSNKSSSIIEKASKKMKLVFYSGGSAGDNAELDQLVIEMIDKRRPSFTFIPSSYDYAHDDFEDFIASFSPYGVSDFLMFPVDIPFSSSQMHKAVNRDFVFLGGGNTFSFLKHLKRSGVYRALRTYAKRGGILGGLSAGGIIQTPSIHTAAFPEFDRDDNQVGLKNWKSLGLANFEFFPHYLNSRDYIDELLNYSLESKWPLYACPDGSGIVVNDGHIQFVGRVWCYFQGERFRLI